VKKIPKILGFSDSGVRWCPAWTRCEEGDDADGKGPLFSEGKERGRVVNEPGRGRAPAWACWAGVGAGHGRRELGLLRLRKKELGSRLPFMPFQNLSKANLNYFEFWIKTTHHSKSNAMA
jgi:hypothetical protein